MGKVTADFQTPPSLTPPEGDVSFNSINNTPIGGVTPSSGAFTTLSASTSATLDTITIGGGSTISKILTTTATVTFGSLSPGAFADSTVSLSGATTGSSVSVGLPVSHPQMVGVIAWVSASGVVTIRATNNSDATIYVSSGFYRITTIQF